MGWGGWRGSTFKWFKPEWRGLARLARSCHVGYSKRDPNHAGTHVHSIVPNVIDPWNRRVTDHEWPVAPSSVGGQDVSGLSWPICRVRMRKVQGDGVMVVKQVSSVKSAWFTLVS